MSFENHNQFTPSADLTVTEISQIRQVEADLDDLEQQAVVSFNSRDVRSRPFNLLRTQIVRKMREEKWKVMAVTSGAPNAGKSFVTANLAAALGQLADLNVLVFDLDLRRASLAQRMGVAQSARPSAGMTDYLDGTVARVSDIGTKVMPLNVTLFPSRAAPVNSAELLINDRLPRLLDAIKALPDDYIALLDLPPVFANDDAMAVIQHVDCYLFVIEEGITTKTQVKDAMNLLSPAACIGTVLNRYVERSGDSYGYSDSYAHYYSDNAKK